MAHEYVAEACGFLMIELELVREELQAGRVSKADCLKRIQVIRQRGWKAVEQPRRVHGTASQLHL